MAKSGSAKNTKNKALHSKLMERKKIRPEKKRIKIKIVKRRWFENFKNN